MNRLHAEVSKLNRIRHYPVWILLVLCIGLQWGLGLAHASYWPLSGDEALYAFWARHWLEHRDPLFLAHWIDKPPLFLWGQTLFFALWGSTQAAARYGNLLATSLLTILLCGYAWYKWGPGSGLIALILATLNPLLLAYAPTGLTDPPLILWSTLSLLLAWTCRPRSAGIALALALFTKQTAVLHIPLILGALFLAQPQAWRSTWLQWGIGFLLIALPLQAWDMLRWFQAPSFWWLGFEHYAPLRWVPTSVWMPRSQTWLQLLPFLWGTWWGWVGWAVLLTLACIRIRQRPASGNCDAHQILWLLIWSGSYLLVHLVMTFNAWMRYLLPLVPHGILMAAWAGQTLGYPKTQLWIRGCGLLALLVLVLGSGWTGPRAWKQQLPAGPRNRELIGLPEALAYVTAHVPQGTVLFHHELSWHYLFYLFDDDILTRVWYADPADLATQAQSLPPQVPKIQLRLARDAYTTEQLAHQLATLSLYHVRCLQMGAITVYEIQDVATPICRHIAAPDF